MTDTIYPSNIYWIPAVCHGVCWTLKMQKWIRHHPSLKELGCLGGIAYTISWNTYKNFQALLSVPLPRRGGSGCDYLGWLSTGIFICLSVPRVVWSSASSVGFGYEMIELIFFQPHVAMSRMSTALSSGHLGRPCPHSTSVTTALDHFFGKCPQRKLEATWGHSIHCFSIMPYFWTPRKTVGRKRLFQSL